MSQWLICLMLLLFTGSRVSACGVLMIDLNNSDDEDQSCIDGIKASNAKNHTHDGYWQMGGSGTANRRIDAGTLTAKIDDIEKHGGCIDSIIISGHDANGHFFGTNGTVLSSEMAAIVKSHPILMNTLSTMALGGCYTTSDYSCENLWMRNISPNLQATVGFTLRSPDDEQKGDPNVYRGFCQHRTEIAQAGTADKISQVVSLIPGFNSWQMGVCLADGLCSRAYGAVGEKKTCYHTYEELNNRCGEFDPRDKKVQYQKYLAAEGKSYERPPCDGKDDYRDPGQVCDKKSGLLRQFYDQVELWEQCVGRIATETGYLMPDPEQVIRLVKFPLLKANFGYREKEILKDYNAKLRDLHLDQDTIDDLDKMSRAEVVTSTSGAVADLSRLIQKTPSGQEINGVNPRKLLAMAKGADLALRELDPRCTDFSWVHEDVSPTLSECFVEYGKDPTWPPQK